MTRRILVALNLAVLAVAPSREPAVVEVPFTSPRHQVVVQVTLDGHGPYPMLLDTGTDPSAVDATLARSLRAPGDTTLHEGSGTGAGPIRGFDWPMRNVRVGGVHADRVASGATDLSRPAARLGIALAGVLGYSFLAGRIVQIDYPRHVVRFYRDQPPPPTHTLMAEFPLRPDTLDAIPRIRGRVNGRPAWIAYDSGASGALGISPMAIERLGLADAFAAARPDSATGYGGRIDTRRGRVPLVELGPLKFADVECTFVGAHGGMLADTSLAHARIGNALLDSVVVTLDYRAMRVRFER